MTEEYFRWLLPDDAYPTDDPVQRQRIDDALRSRAHELPQEPGRYLDVKGDIWRRHESGVWQDKHGESRPVTWNPTLVMMGPWTGPLDDDWTPDKPFPHRNDTEE